MLPNGEGHGSHWQKRGWWMYPAVQVVKVMVKGFLGKM